MFVPRDLMERIERFRKRREIVIIQGPRRSGKTTLMKMIMRKTSGPKAFVNMDRYEEKEAFEKNPLRFVEKHLPERRGVLFLDEIQGCRDAGPGLKLIYDEMEEVKVYASGSSSLSLRWDVGKELVGRAAIFTLLTFNFHEFLLSRDRGLAKIVEEAKKSLEGTIRGEDEPEEPLYSQEILPLLDEYVVWGGYPEVVLAEKDVKEEVLAGIVDLYLERDVAGYFGVEHGEKFLSFARLLAHSMGSPLSLSSLASGIGISYKTAERYLYILEQSFVVRRVPPFYSNLSTELRKAKKVYFLDTGARNWLVGNFLPISNREDAGKLLEAYVHRELMEKWKNVRYWRTAGGAEVDFVVEGVPLEVKTHGGVRRGFYSFLRAYKPPVAVVLSLGEFKIEKRGETKVYWVPLWYA